MNKFVTTLLPCTEKEYVVGDTSIGEQGCNEFMNKGDNMCLSCLLIIAGFVLLPWLLVIIGLLHNAPKGYEDETGFHYEKQHK